MPRKVLKPFVSDFTTRLLEKRYFGILVSDLLYCYMVLLTICAVGSVLYSFLSSSYLFAYSGLGCFVVANWCMTLLLVGRDSTLFRILDNVSKDNENLKRVYDDCSAVRFALFLTFILLYMILSRSFLPVPEDADTPANGIMLALPIMVLLCIGQMITHFLSMDAVE